MAKKVRIGFVGVGAMGQCAHLRNYVDHPECEVVAIAEIRPKLREEVAARYGIKAHYPDHSSMLESEQLDGIVASQPFTRHGVLLPELLTYNIPIFTEKPLASTIAAGESILKALSASTTWHMVGYHKRCDPAIVYAKEAIARFQESGELGAMRYVRLTMPPGDWIANGFAGLIGSDEAMPELEQETPAADMDEKTFEAYVEFVNYYIHQVNLLRYLLGQRYKVTYAAPSGVLLVAESEEGITGTIEMAPYNTTQDWQEEALVAFEKGYIRVTLPAPLVLNQSGTVEVFRDPGDGTSPECLKPTLPPVHAMRCQAMRFVEAIRGESMPPCTAAEALEDLKIAREYIRLRLGQ